MFKKVFLLASILFSFNVNAALLGLGTSFVDTDSGNEWLDLSITQGLSYNDVNTLLAVGGDLEGWSYASYASVQNMFTNAGATFLNQSLFRDNHWEVATTIMDVWGQTVATQDTSVSFLYSTHFLVSDENRFTANLVKGIAYFDLANPADVNGQGVFNYGGSVQHKDESSQSVGSALVRTYTGSVTSTVPSPSTLLLLSFGFIGLIISRKRND
jgi:hypothetical protein